jgi:uncharacterized DUF497 family protein
MGFAFEFNPAKAKSNLKKHSTSFAEAMTVFDDPLAQTFPDDLHSEDEERFITIGLSSAQRLLFARTLSRTTIRLIGARPADNAEREAYEELKRRP